MSNYILLINSIFVQICNLQVSGQLNWSFLLKVLRTFDSMLSEGATNEMVKAGVDLQTHTSVS